MPCSTSFLYHKEEFMTETTLVTPTPYTAETTAETPTKDTIKEKLVKIIKDLNNPPKQELNMYYESLKTQVLDVIDEYENLRKVTEYLSGMVESLHKRINNTGE